MSDYMMILLVSGLGPFLLSLYRPLRFYNNLWALARTIFSIVIIFSLWDIFATSRGHWYFEPDRVWDLRIFNLPVEEILFFVVIPFCSIFTWEMVKYLKKLK